MRSDPRVLGVCQTGLITCVKPYDDAISIRVSAIGSLDLMKPRWSKVDGPDKCCVVTREVLVGVRLVRRVSDHVPKESIQTTSSDIVVQ